MKRKILVGCAVTAAICFCGVSSWALPGVLQNATRAGFWSNSFPDQAFLVNNYIYKSWDKNFNDSGDKKDAGDTYRFTADLIRLIRPWHFGDQKEYQFILQGILPYYNVSASSIGGTGDVSGVGDPLTYTALGWNNPDKTTAVQAALIVRYPLGASDAPLHTNAYAVTPTLAVQQKFGKMFMGELAAAYQQEFHQLSDSGSRGQSYFELNGIGTAMFGATDVFLQADYTKYGSSRTAGESNGNSGYNLCLSPGVGRWFLPNMQLSLKYDIDVKGENTPAAQGFNLRYVWIF